MEEKVKKILVTGFTPYWRYKENRSQEVCHWLESQADLKSKIQVRIIKVERFIGFDSDPHLHFDTPGQLTNVGRTDFNAGLAEQPAGIFMLGELRGLTGVHVEPYAIKDDSHVGTRYTRAAAFRAEHSQLPIRILPGKITSRIGNAGCNELFGMAISHAKKYTPVIPVEFLHCGFGLSMDEVCRIIKSELLRMISTAL